MCLRHTLLTVLTFTSFSNAAYDILDYVNLLIGTANGGLGLFPVKTE